VEIEFSPRALLDLEAWRHSGNLKAQEKISRIVESIVATPFSGIGKPEPLKHDFTGLWSRRITKGDRLVYEVGESLITIHSLKGHY
jgi:toxin YoeB